MLACHKGCGNCSSHNKPENKKEFALPFQKMSQDDHDAVLIMRDEGALQEVRPSDLPEGGYIKVACPDGDTTPELLKHFHFTLCPQNNKNRGERVCTHSILVAGGPGAIPNASPMHVISRKDGRRVCAADEFVFAQIETALMVKGDRVPNLALCPHCSCGAATVSGLSVWDNFRLSFLAKDRIKKEFPHTFNSVKVMPHINFSGYPKVDGSKEPFRTYVLRREKFLRSYDRHAHRLMTAA